MTRRGPLALVGGAELQPGNEPIDRVLVEAAGDGAAYVLATAAARQQPASAVDNARRWFAELGLDVEELPAVKRADVTSAVVAERARAGRLFYLVGGDPGLVPKTLIGTPVWAAIVEAWQDGAALAGASAGAMALGEWTLVRERMPGDDRRRYASALGVLPGVAVLPHFDTFGHRWVESALRAAPRPDVVLVGPDERTAAVWRTGGWRALGAGAVTVVTPRGSRSFAAGEAIEGLPSPRATASRVT
jgi:cyanophycinase